MAPYLTTAPLLPLQNIVLAPELAAQPEAAVRAMQEARATELEWTAPSTPGDDLEAEKQRMVEQLALSILQGRMVEAHKRDTQTEDAERMAQLLIEEEEESKKAQQKKVRPLTIPTTRPHHSPLATPSPLATRHALTPLATHSPPLPHPSGEQERQEEGEAEGEEGGRRRGRRHGRRRRLARKAFAVR